MKLNQLHAGCDHQFEFVERDGKPWLRLSSHEISRMFLSEAQITHREIWKAFRSGLSKSGKLSDAFGQAVLEFARSIHWSSDTVSMNPITKVLYLPGLEIELSLDDDTVRTFNKFKDDPRYVARFFMEIPINVVLERDVLGRNSRYIGKFKGFQDTFREVRKIGLDFVDRMIAIHQMHVRNSDGKNKDQMAHRSRQLEAYREALTEATFNQIVKEIDPDFLKQRIRADALEGIQLAGFNDDEMSFWVKSSLYRNNATRYMNTFRFREWQEIGEDLTMRPIDRARMLMFSGNLELNCTCPSFLYYGYRYILDMGKPGFPGGASLIPEKRPPVKNNPQLRGIVCKHLNRSLRSFPFYAGDVANELKRQFGAQSGLGATADKKSRRADAVRKNRIIDVDFSEIA